MDLQLKPITPFNWVACMDLQPTPEQQDQNFVAPNVLSMAQAYAERWWVPLAIYVDNELVGFLMYGRWTDEPKAPWWGERETGVHCILRFMIAGNYQGRGYGRAALEALIERIRQEPEARAIELDYDLHNTAARLYTAAGFRPILIEEGEVRARLELA